MEGVWLSVSVVLVLVLIMLVLAGLSVSALRDRLDNAERRIKHLEDELREVYWKLGNDKRK